MEEAWELAAVRLLPIKKRQGVRFQINHDDPKVMQRVREHYRNDVVDSKYIMLGNVAVLVFLMKTLEIKFGGNFYSTRAYLVPFVLSFIASAYAYRKSFSIDSDWFLLEMNGTVSERTAELNADANILVLSAKEKNDRFVKAMQLSIALFSLGLFLLLLLSLGINILGFLDRIVP